MGRKKFPEMLSISERMPLRQHD